ncbi:MAG: hypothetical protein KIT31_13890 [Deltaproteobacteria bacterium]|nr:hypothetical protein [Deltaproteobacteria bacterium]
MSYEKSNTLPFALSSDSTLAPSSYLAPLAPLPPLPPLPALPPRVRFGAVANGVDYYAEVPATNAWVFGLGLALGAIGVGVLWARSESKE